MGIVYRAYDRNRDQMVALKTMPWLSSTVLQRFKREFRALADLSHPNLVRLHELVSDGRNWFFTMELLEGKNFLAYLRARSPGASRTNPTPTISPAQQARLRDALRQLTEGVIALHDAGKLHRDIKPSNVMVTEQGRVVLLDFGLVAELEGTNQHESTEPRVLGTVAYMAPEQADSQPVSAASDWYSVGVMLYEALTGRVPFRGSPLEVLALKQGPEPPPPHSLVPQLPEDLDQLCMALLQREPSLRPSGREVLQRLGSASQRSQPEAPARLPSGRMPLVGRERHLDFLRAAYAATARGKTVLVHVHGRSGEGKTALIEAFLDELAEQNEALVLSGRCYERESVPYKALDSLIDALVRHLRHLPSMEAQVVLPRDVLSLSRLFPMLQSVEPVKALPKRSVEVPDPQELRRRAFIALRELLARLGDRKPLVLFIDDLHWGDVDSAALLSELLRPPDSPVFLLLGCHRSEDAATSPFLREFVGTNQGKDDHIDRRELVLEALTLSEAEALATELLGPGDPSLQAQAAAIARESGGTAIFVHELVRHARTERTTDQPAVPGEIAFEAVLWTRIERLSPQARRLLEIVAVSGRPLGRSEAFRAAELDADGWTALADLRSGRLVRATAPGERDEIETYHDRIREAVLAHLAPSASETHHRRLAMALEESGRADPETLAVHFQGAKAFDRAGENFALAADRAATALAFDRASKLYRLALGLQPLQPEEEYTLRMRLGDALANAGRGAEAAREYLAAATLALHVNRLEPRRRAALQLLISGHVDEGTSTLADVLASVDMSLPSTRGRALASLLWHRALLRLRTPRFRRVDESQVSKAALTRIDLCWTAVAGLSAVDPVMGALYQSRGLLLALRAGEPHRIVRAMAMEAIHLSTAGGPSCRRVSHLLNLAGPLAECVDNPHSKATTALARAIAHFFLGEWRSAGEEFDRAEAMLRDHCSGVFWELDMAQHFSLHSLIQRGELNLARQRLPILLLQAQERGNLYSEGNLNTYLMMMLKLSDDDSEEIDRHMASVMQRWTQKGFSTQHSLVFKACLHYHLYRQDVTAACSLLATTWPGYERSMLPRFQMIRIAMYEARARCVLAAAAESPNPKALLRSAECDARRLQREQRPWAGAFAKFIRAGVAIRRAEFGKATELLTQAATAFDVADMNLNAAVARRCLGELIGGERGESLVAEAEAWMAMQQIRHPARWAAMYAPGYSPSWEDAKR
jgi:serine/threonine protein kinase